MREILDETRKARGPDVVVVVPRQVDRLQPEYPRDRAALEFRQLTDGSEP